MRWVFDDGATRHGLHDPGNTLDGIGYHDGSLDMASVVPVMFISSRNVDPLTEPLLGVDLELAVDEPEPAAYPVGCGCQASAEGLGLGLAGLLWLRLRRLERRQRLRVLIGR